MNNNKIYTVYGINSSISVINSTSCKVEEIVLTKNSNAFKSDKLNQEINRNHLEGKIKFVEYLGTPFAELKNKTKSVCFLTD